MKHGFNTREILQAIAIARKHTLFFPTTAVIFKIHPPPPSHSIFLPRKFHEQIKKYKSRCHRLEHHTGRIVVNRSSPRLSLSSMWFLQSCPWSWHPPDPPSEPPSSSFCCGMWLSWFACSSGTFWTTLPYVYHEIHSQSSWRTRICSTECKLELRWWLPSILLPNPLCSSPKRALSRELKEQVLFVLSTFFSELCPLFSLRCR